MPVLAPIQPLTFQHQPQLVQDHSNQIKSYQVQQSLKHLREKAKEHEIELMKQMTTATAITTTTAANATAAASSSISNSSTSSAAGIGNGVIATSSNGSPNCVPSSNGGGSGNGGGSLMLEKRRESSQPKLISAETVSKNMQPNIHLQFNSIKAAATATGASVGGSYAPIQQHQYFNRNWAVATTTASAANSYPSPSSGTSGPTTNTSSAASGLTLPPPHFQRLASSTPKPHIMASTGYIDHHHMMPSYPTMTTNSHHHNHQHHQLPTYNYYPPNNNHHHLNQIGYQPSTHQSQQQPQQQQQQQQQKSQQNQQYNLLDRSFSENTYENCHIYENSKPRSKSVETYLSSSGGRNRNPYSNQALIKNQPAMKNEQRGCSTENLDSKGGSANSNTKRDKNELLSEFKKKQSSSNGSILGSAIGGPVSLATTTTTTAETSSNQQQQEQQQSSKEQQQNQAITTTKQEDSGNNNNKSNTLKSNNQSNTTNYNKRINRSMEILDVNMMSHHPHQTLPFAYMPPPLAATHRHGHRRRHHRQHLNEIDWSSSAAAYEVERGAGPDHHRYLEAISTGRYGEPPGRLSRKSRPRGHHQHSDIEELFQQHQQQFTPRIVVDRVFHYRKARSQSNDSKLGHGLGHGSESRSNSQSSSCKKLSYSEISGGGGGYGHVHGSAMPSSGYYHHRSVAAHHGHHNSHHHGCGGSYNGSSGHRHRHGHSSRHPSASSAAGHRQPSNGGGDSTKSRSKMIEKEPSIATIATTTTTATSVVDSAVQTTQSGNNSNSGGSSSSNSNGTNSSSSSNGSGTGNSSSGGGDEQQDENNYVKELKRQLEILKNEITRLQNAQSNLEKSLKQTTTAFRPFMYTGFGGDAAEFSDFTSLEQFLNSLDPSSGGPFQLAGSGANQSPSSSVNGAGVGANKASPNSASSGNLTNSAAAALLGCALDSSSAAAFLNLQQSAGQHPAYHIFDPASLNENIYNLSQFNVKSKEIMENLNCTSTILHPNHYHQLIQAAAAAPSTTSTMTSSNAATAQQIAAALNTTNQSTPSTSTSHLNSASSAMISGGQHNGGTTTASPSSNTSLSPTASNNKSAATNNTAATASMHQIAGPQYQPGGVLISPIMASPVIKAGATTTSIYGDVELIKSACKMAGASAPGSAIGVGGPQLQQHHAFEIITADQYQQYQQQQAAAVAAVAQQQHQSRVNSKPPTSGSSNNNNNNTQSNNQTNGVKKPPQATNPNPNPNASQSTIWSSQTSSKPAATANKPPIPTTTTSTTSQQNIPAIVPINYDQLMASSTSTKLSPTTQYQQRSASSKPDTDSNRNFSNPSPNALLYQKLLELVSTSADLANQNELSTQMSTLLSNPNIKARLKQLHTQLLKDPNEYWPKLENILLDDSKLQKQMLPPKDQIKITQDLIDLKNFYSKEYFNNNNSNNNNNNNVNSTMTINNNNSSCNINGSNSNGYYSKTQPRIINREIKK